MTVATSGQKHWFDEDVLAVIVTYGDRFDLAAGSARSALLAGAKRVLIVNNGCVGLVTAELQKFLDENDEGLIRMIKLPTNLGSAGGFAAGLEFAQNESNLKWVWLLDDDNWATPNCLREAFKTLRAWPRGDGAPAAVACFRPSDSAHARLKLGEAVGDVFPTPGSTLGFDFRRRFYRRLPSEMRRDFVVVPSAPYGGLLVTVSATLTVGPPRTDFILYQDDTEYTERLTNAGLTILLTFAGIVVDADGRQLPNTAVRGLVRYLRTPELHQNRLYYTIRNCLALDRIRAIRLVDRVSLLINGMIVCSAFAFFSVLKRENRISSGTVRSAVFDAARNKLGAMRALP